LGAITVDIEVFTPVVVERRVVDLGLDPDVAGAGAKRKADIVRTADQKCGRHRRLPATRTDRLVGQIGAVTVR
jgi:hypothetical protein